MDQVGTVVGLNGPHNVILQILPTSQCVKCGACGKLHHSRHQIEVENTIGAALGDQVILAVEPSNLKISCFLYGIPTLLFLIGLIGGYYTFHSELAGMAGATIMMGLSLLPIRWFARRFQPRLLRLVHETEKINIDQQV